METRYTFSGKTFDAGQLQAEVVAAGLNPLAVNGGGYSGPGTPATEVEVVFADALDSAGVAALNAVVAAHAPAVARRKRTLLAIRADLAALSTAKKNAVWSDLTSGTPPKWSTDQGEGAPALAVLTLLGASATLSAADVLEAKLRGVAIYCRDNVSYLVNPSWDPTISIPGDEPVP